MGKVASAVLCVVLLIAGITVPVGAHRGWAQTPIPAAGCNGQVTASAMPGQYTGTWQTDGLYHFYVFGKDLELGLTINGTLNLQILPGGAVSGTARAEVVAPVTHDGKQDISSGTGTISGSLNGTLTPTGATWTLSQPIIDMEWGTFDPSGHIERYIQMPDFQFALSNQTCVGLSGTIAETGFPEQTIVDDGTPYITQASGVGTSSGAWIAQNSDTATFVALSNQVSEFVSSASAVLATSPSPDTIQSQIATPLAALVGQIRAHPDVADCLLQRLAAWEATAGPAVLATIPSAPGTDLATLRRSGDLLREVKAIDPDCALDLSVASQGLVTGTTGAVDAAIHAGDWSDFALAAREALLDAPTAQASLQTRIDSDLHTLLPSLSSTSELRDLARVAYAVNDNVDVALAYKRLTSTAHLRDMRSGHGKKKKHKKHTKSRKPAPPPAPPTLSEVLGDGMTAMQASATTSATPTFSWQPVAGADRYVVFVMGNGSGKLTWMWSGTSTSVAYGDTALAGDPMTAPAWPVPPDTAGSRWSVLALDPSGHIISGTLRRSA